MTDHPIPDRLMGEAEVLAEDMLGMAWRRRDAEIIARAMMARDQRAAEIARDRMPATMDCTSDHIAAACEDIADAILSYDNEEPAH